MSLLDTGKTGNYTIGGTRILFSEEISTGVFSEYFDLGNIVSASIAAEIDRLEHFTAKTGTRTKDREVVRQASFSIPFSFDEPNAYNLNLLFMGKKTGVTTVAADVAAVVDEAHTVTQGRAFFLNKLANTTPTIVVTVGVTPCVLGVDYELVVIGKTVGVRALVGSIVLTDGATALVDYTAAVPAAKKIVPLDNPAKSGKAKLLFVSDTGNEFQWAIPSVSISPDGDFAYNDQDWSAVGMRMAVQSDGSAEPYGTILHFGVGENI